MEELTSDELYQLGGLALTAAEAKRREADKPDVPAGMATIWRDQADQLDALGTKTRMQAMRRQ